MVTQFESVDDAIRARARALDVLAETTPKDRKNPAAYPERARSFLTLTRVETVGLSADGVPFRVYVHHPKQRESGCPVHVNVHGGGFYFPHGENDAMYSAYLADRIGGIVVDIDYTCSGEAPYPVAFDQCYEAVRWALSQCDAWGASADRVSMGGYSAGGTLTAWVALRAARTGDFRLCLQVLGYPPLDFAIPGAYKMEGFNGSASWLRRMGAFNDLLFGNSLRGRETDPEVSPVYARPELLAKLPRTVMLPAASCTFRFEDMEYANRLAAHGVEVTVRVIPGTRYGFIPHFFDGWETAAELIVRAICSSEL